MCRSSGCIIPMATTPRSPRFSVASSSPSRRWPESSACERAQPGAPTQSDPAASTISLAPARRIDSRKVPCRPTKDCVDLATHLAAWRRRSTRKAAPRRSHATTSRSAASVSMPMGILIARYAISACRSIAIWRSTAGRGCRPMAQSRLAMSFDSSQAGARHSRAISRRMRSSA